MAECIFCQIVGGAIPTAKLYEDDQVIAFDDINPQARVHILVIPKRHVVSLDDTQDSDSTLLGQLMVCMCENGQRACHCGKWLSSGGEHWEGRRPVCLSSPLACAGRSVPLNGHPGNTR